MASSGIELKMPYNKIEVLVDGKSVFVGRISYMAVCPSTIKRPLPGEKQIDVYNGEGKIYIDFEGDYEISIVNLTAPPAGSP